MRFVFLLLVIPKDSRLIDEYNNKTLILDSLIVFFSSPSFFFTSCLIFKAWKGNGRFPVIPLLVLWETCARVNGRIRLEEKKNKTIYLGL